MNKHGLRRERERELFQSRITGSCY